MIKDPELNRMSRWLEEYLEELAALRDENRLLIEQLKAAKAPDTVVLSLGQKFIIPEYSGSYEMRLNSMWDDEGVVRASFYRRKDDET